MAARFLLDTHILVRWFSEPGKLSRSQLRILRNAVARGEHLAISSITLMEIAFLVAEARNRIKVSAYELFHDIEASDAFLLLPITFEIATDAAALGQRLRDPADCAIVATARVHGLKLITSDRRIIQSELVSTIE